MSRTLEALHGSSVPGGIRRPTWRSLGRPGSGTPVAVVLSKVFDVFDQCPLILIAKVVTVVMTLVLNEVRARAHLQQPLQHSGLSFRVVDRAQLVELGFRPPVEYPVDVSEQDGFCVLWMHVR